MSWSELPVKKLVLRFVCAQLRVRANFVSVQTGLCFLDLVFCLCRYANMCLSLLKFQVCTLLQVHWSGRQLREAAVELQDAAQAEAQRRAAQHSHLALILPPHVLHILTLGKLACKLAARRARRILCS